ncbi:subtilisin-like protein [Anaeromyces robustus]|uniref:Subtilisin-like protein n=1 Tax=Anaeromyces robustus TaxID=1754192 RepID=A0A1Y1WAX9_9FUNG|nr:subtilisin-like protein [Anaeromyces robustus]|eukprot:ORX70396.1 subtilisin-like protein [Anaeromyces robustus]
MNDIYEIIRAKQKSYILEDGKLDSNLNELEVSVPFLKRRKLENDLEESEIESNIESDIESNIETDTKTKTKTKDIKFRFVNRNRPSKNSSSGHKLNPNEKYISLESKLVNHLCPIGNYYAVRAYLSDEVMEEVKKLPNIIACDKTTEFKKPTYQMKHLNTTLLTKLHRKSRRSDKFYDLNYIKKETGWSGVSVQEYSEAHLAVISQFNYNEDLASIFDYNYYYPSTAGQGIDIYLIDEGLYVNHEEFDTYNGKRTVTCDAIIEGGTETITRDGKKKSCSYDNEYQDHGNMVASVAAGAINGVAKKANIHMIATGFTDADLTVALDFIKVHGKPHKSVINVSRNGVNTFNENLQNKIDEMINAGFIIFASAGNDAEDACDEEYPNKISGYGNIISVGATFNKENFIEGAYTAAEYSNYGKCIDIQGPGYVTAADFYECDYKANSSKICENYAYTDGTSFSSPILAGVAALIMAEHSGTQYNHKSMKKILMEMSLKNVIQDLGSEDTPNRFVNNGKHIVYSPDNNYMGCGILAGNFKCSSGCCTKKGYCVSSTSSDHKKECKIENGCQPEYGTCQKENESSSVTPQNEYGMSIELAQQSLDINSKFASVYLSD